MAIQNTWAFLGSLTACAGFISALGLAARCNVLEKTLSRKVMHIGVSVRLVTILYEHIFVKDLT